jgi:hypothetical protein
MNRKRDWLYPAAFILVIAHTAFVDASYASDHVPRTCFSQLDHAVHPGETVRILTRSDSLIKGAYVGLDPDRSKLMLRVGNEAVSPLEIPIQEIRTLKYRSSGHVRMKYSLYGLAVGAAAGALIGAIHRDTSHHEGLDFSFRMNPGSGAAVVGFAGLLLGPLFSIGPHDHSISCEK